MYIPRLDEFTTEQLQAILNLIVLRRIEIDADYELNDYVKVKDEFESLLLWQTQILNAIGKVGVQDQINNN